MSKTKIGIFLSLILGLIPSLSLGAIQRGSIGRPSINPQTNVSNVIWEHDIHAKDSILLVYCTFWGEDEVYADWQNAVYVNINDYNSNTLFNSEIDRIASIDGNDGGTPSKATTIYGMYLNNYEGNAIINTNVSGAPFPNIICGSQTYQGTSIGTDVTQLRSQGNAVTDFTNGVEFLNYNSGDYLFGTAENVLSEPIYPSTSTYGLDNIDARAVITVDNMGIGNQLNVKVGDYNELRLLAILLKPEMTRKEQAMATATNVLDLLYVGLTALGIHKFLT